MFTRAQVIRDGLVGAAGIAFAGGSSWLASVSETGASLCPFVERLSTPGDGIVVARPTSAGRYALTLRSISRRLHPSLSKTPLWAYDDGSGLAGQAGSFGMVIPAETGSPLRVSHPRPTRRRALRNRPQVIASIPFCRSDHAVTQAFAFRSRGDC
jgi:hypothetical protein